MARGRIIVARLLDDKGFTIAEGECDTKAEAIERCRYFLSDRYAQAAETTHEALGTAKAEVLVNGECDWDSFLSEKSRAWRGY